MDQLDDRVKEHYENSSSSKWLTWRATCFQSLLSAESKLLQYIQNSYRVSFVPIKNNTEYLRTITVSRLFENFENQAIYENKIPIILIHGLGAGLGFWCKNADSISDTRKFYALDLLGFGLSSRPVFPTDPVKVEQMFVESLEEWRKNMGIETFILLGHSFGGYIACAYALKYPQCVRHLIHADPWGMCRSDQYKLAIFKNNFILRTFYPVLQHVNPMSFIRLYGPLGKMLIRKYFKDLGQYFQRNNNSDDSISVESDDLLDYIYHCNSQNPSGENAFKTLSEDLGSAHCNMIERTDELDKNLRMTFVLGENSWLDNSVGLQFSEKRPHSYVNIRILSSCGHYLFAEDSVKFNAVVNDICSIVDDNMDMIFEMQQ